MLAKNMFFNLVGLASPILLALICIPPLIALLGTPAFGLLTLVWVVLGYFSIFDLGIGRALTLAVAGRRATGNNATIRPLVSAGLLLTGALGCAGAAVLAMLASHLAMLMGGTDLLLVRQAELALYAVAGALPFVTTTAALRGVLEAYDRFDITSAIRLAMGFITYGGPLVVLQFYSGLVPVVIFLALARVVTWAVHFVAIRRVLPAADGKAQALGQGEIRRLLISGGWMSVSNIISPLLSYLDRFVVAYLVGASMVAYYTTPYEAISRLTIIPEAVLGVLFPALGAAMATSPERAHQLFGQSLRVMLAVMLPVAALLVAFAHPLLALWISPEFSDKSFRVLQILTLGIAVNCVARVTFTAIQSAGRADATAKLHLCEFPGFLLLLYWLTTRHGIEGAALAWALRATVDFILLLWMQSLLMPVRHGIKPFTVLLVLASWAGAWFAGSPGMQGGHLPAAAGAGVLAVLVGTFAVLTEDDRRMIIATFGRMLNRRAAAP
jgi:O-antigen/teichoic acid export membrane protein